MEELYLNDLRVDFKSGSVSLTSQINDIAELKDRQVGYTNSIKLPLTSRNKKALNLLGVTGNTSTVPYSKLKVKYIYNGIELISNGYGVIKSTGKDFELVVYNNSKDIFSEIEDKTLEDLDFSAYDHNLDIQEFLDSHSNTSGYIYPLANYYGSGDASFVLQTFSPCFFVHTLFEMIFNQAGYTISGDIFSNIEYKSRVTTMQKGYDRPFANQLSILLTDDETSGSTEDYEYTGVQTITFLRHTYTALSDGNIIIQGIGDIIAEQGDGSDYNIIIDVQGNILNIPKSLFFSQEFRYYVNSGDVINIYLEATSILTGLPNDHSRIRFHTDYRLRIYDSVEYSEVDISKEIGDTSQKDFIKDVMQRYGMILERVRNTNEYRFTTMKALLTDKDNAENWSSKYSNFIKEEYKPNYARINIFKFDYDNDAEGSTTYADGYLRLSNQNLEDSKTIVESIFTATNEFQLTEFQLTDQLYYGEAYYIKHWEYVPPQEGEPEFYEFKPLDNNLRIFKLINKVRDIGVASIWGGTAREFSLIAMPYLYFEDVDYNYELSNSYVEIKDMLQDYRIVTAEMNLSLLDNYNLDFFKLKYINQLGGYFYLNKVKEFKKGKKTKVELIEI